LAIEKVIIGILVVFGIIGLAGIFSGNPVVMVIGLGTLSFAIHVGSQT
jgi:uncharacterized membrane protein YkgB